MKKKGFTLIELLVV
ncbi:MAG: prepilin-type N-terminal cleavage/methylation domain-containing protein, partial [Candidatus Hydrogenedentes bacterium]|nr:prepilin-type N-terminal cleavage/methylation domain-containing protein [Candidatus Hydrogenedentota bacterium]